MGKRAVRIIDGMVSLVITACGGISACVLMAVSVFRRGPKLFRGRVQLYISIMDFRDSVLSSYRNDILVDGYLARSVCYHFDFEKGSDEEVLIGTGIVMRNVSVHPDGVLTRIGLSRTAACIVGMCTFLRMLSCIHTEGVSIIRAHDPHFLGLNALLCSRIMKIPYIVQICSNYEIKDRRSKGLTFRPFRFPWIERMVERFVMRQADTVLTDRDHYRSFGLIPGDIPRERYTNVGFYVDQAHYAPPDKRRNLKGELGIDRKTRVVLYVGRLEPVKYTLDLIDIMVGCCNELSDICLVVAGDGLLKEAMRKEARVRTIGDAILFLDNVSHDRLPDLYATADVTCFTSAGFTLIEAALAQRCIVAYDFEWHRDFIGDNERGILVPFRDSDAASQALVRVLKDEDMRRTLATRARDYALQNYVRSRSIEKELDVYRTLFERRGYHFEKTV